MRAIEYVKAAAAVVVMVLIGGCGGTDHTPIDDTTPPPLSKPPAQEESVPSNWYVRVSAEIPNKGMKTLSAQLGQLEEADTVKKHTLKALTPFGGNYLDVVFRDPPGVESGDYKVNFHQYEANSTDNWTFRVRTDDVNADVIVSWRGLYVLTPYQDDQNRQRYKEYRSVTNPLISHMKLIDVKSGEEIAAAVNGKVQSYAFNMDGEKERIFQWVVQRDPVTIPEPKRQNMKAAAIRKDAKMMQRTIERRREERFDLSKPPMFKENTYGE